VTPDFLLTPDDAFTKSAADAKIHVRGSEESENGHPLIHSHHFRSMENKTSLSPPGNNYNINNARRFAPMDRKEDGVESNQSMLGSQVNGRAGRKKTSRNAKEKNVRNSYKQGDGELHLEKFQYHLL